MRAVTIINSIPWRRDYYALSGIFQHAYHSVAGCEDDGSPDAACSADSRGDARRLDQAGKLRLAALQKEIDSKRKTNPDTTQAKFTLMDQKTASVGGKAGVDSIRTKADCPNVMANATDKAVSIVTFVLPPHSICMHPGPVNGATVRW